MNRKIILIVTILAVAFVLLAGIAVFGIFGTSANGRIVDKRTGKPVANASVRIGEKLGHTDKNGYYTLKVGQGNKEVMIKATGYEVANFKVNVPIYFSANIGTSKIENGIVSGEVTEDIPLSHPVANLKVTLAGKEIKGDDKGRYTEYNVPVGSVMIVAEAPGYEKYEKKITVRGGKNNFAVAMSLTPDSTTMHYLEAIKQRNFSFIYDTLHPDRQQQWGTKAEYISIKEQQSNNFPMTITAYAAQSPIMLPSYTDPITGKTYENVARVPYSETAQSPLLAILGMPEYTFAASDYMVKVGGRWLSLGGGEPVDKSTEPVF